MSDEMGAGASDAGGSVDSGSDSGRIVAEVNHPQAHDATKAFKDRAFEAMGNSKDDDASDYIDEKRDRKAEEESGELSSARKQARAERFQRALAAAERSGDDGGSSDSRLSQAHQEAVSESHEADLRAREHETIRASAQYEMRVNEFAKQNPDYHDWVQAILPVFPPSEEVAGALLRSPYGPQLTYELVNNIDALEKLNALPPAQALHILAKAEGILMAGEQQQRAPQFRKQVTKAPPPIKSPSGGAGPAKDLHDMAKSDNAEDYIRARRREREASR
jgi:hypothetical protein